MKSARVNRRGATVLELAIVLSAFVVLTFGMLDLGIGVFRYHVLSNAARQAARRAIVHGAYATALGPWGPATIDVTADASGTPIIDGDGDGIQEMLVGCDLANTTVELEWIDASNAERKRVRATVTSPYRPFMFFLVPVTLSASSTMPIAH